MKITDPQIIKDGEKDLIDSVQADLDKDVVRQILKKRLSLDTLRAKGGQIVVHDNEVAFRLDFEINLNGSLLFDRDGNYIEDSMEVDETSASVSSAMEESVEPQENLEDFDLADEDVLNGEEDLEDPSLENDSDFEEEESEFDELLTGEDSAFDDDEEGHDLDDDIDDILKESREFWEQKKNS